MDESVKKTARRQVILAKAYQNTFGQGDGRLVLIDLIGKAGLLSIGHNEEAGREHYENGRRSMVAEILRQLRVDPTKLLALIEERAVDEDGNSE